MRGLFQFVNSGANSSKRPEATHSVRRAASPCFQPRLEILEDRSVPSAVSSITSNFNGTPIPAGDDIWFSSVAKVQGVGSSPATLDVTNQTISFTANNVAYTVNVPDSNITLTPGATSATATYD